MGKTYLTHMMTIVMNRSNMTIVMNIRRLLNDLKSGKHKSNT